MSSAAARNANAPLKPPLEETLSEFLQFARRVNRLQPAAGPCPRDLESKLRELQHTILAGFRELEVARSPVAAATADRVRQARRDLFGCEIALRAQLNTLTEVTTFLSGAEAEAGIYRPDAARRSAPGAWMNMRSSP